MVPGTDSNKYTNIDDEFMTNYVEAEGAIFEERDNRIRILPGSSETAASFEVKNEEHTLGNPLRYIIMKKSVLYVN